MGTAILGGLALILGLVIAATSVPTFPALPWLLAGPLPCLVLGLYAIRKAPEHPIALRLLALGALFAVQVGLLLVIEALLADAGPQRWFWWALVAAETITAALYVVGAQILALLPGGQPGRLLRALWLTPAIPVVAALTQPYLTAPLLIGDVGRLAAPITLATLPGPAVAHRYHAAVLLVGLLLLIVHYIRATGAQGGNVRLALRWPLAAVVLVATGGAIAGVGMLAGAVPRTPAVLWTLALTGALIGLAAAYLAAFAPGRWDGDAALRRGLVYCVLWALLSTAVLVPGMTGRTLLAVAIGIGLAVVLSVAAPQIRRSVTRVAGLRLGGRWVSSRTPLVRVGQALEATGDAESLATRLAAAIHEALGVRWTRIWLIDVAEPAGLAGVEPYAPIELTLALHHNGEDVGFIEVGRRPAQRLSDQDRELLARFADQAATALYHARLAAECADRVAAGRDHAAELADARSALAGSRSRLLAHEDAERRRIAGRLRYGIQNSVADLAARLRLSAGDEQFQKAARDLLITVRELAYDVWPPDLTRDGLSAAVQAHAVRLPLPVNLHSPIGPERFAPTVEHAAFACVRAALASALERVPASAVDVRLTRQESVLVVEVTGPGVHHNHSPTLPEPVQDDLTALDAADDGDDDGIGDEFDAVAARSACVLADRVEAAGGLLDSAEGSVTAHFPVA